MLESIPVKNINNPPYFFRIRGKYFMEFILICSGILLMGIMGAFLFSILGNGWLGFWSFILSVVLIVIVYLLYIKKSKSTPFKDIKKTADMISHINFKDITEC